MSDHLSEMKQAIYEALYQLSPVEQREFLEIWNVLLMKTFSSPRKRVVIGR